MLKKVLFQEELFYFELNGPRAEPSLTITSPHQIGIHPKMECHGRLNETCIFLDDLTEEEKKDIKNLDNSDFDIEEEIKELISKMRK